MYVHTANLNKIFEDFAVKIRFFAKPRAKRGTAAPFIVKLNAVAELSGGYDMGTDIRKEGRMLLHFKCEGPRCALTVNGEQFPFSSIHDISFSGTGIELPLPLQPGMTVKLSFLNAEENIDITGAVAWSDDRPTHLTALNQCSFRTGIRFDEDQVANSNRLFLSLREHMLEPEHLG